MQLYITMNEPAGLTVVLASRTPPRIVVKSEKDHFVLAEVYSPLHVDTDGEAMTKEEIQKMAYRFAIKGRLDCIDIHHNKMKSGCTAVETFIARKNDPDGFIEHSWVLGLIIPSGDTWEKVKKGELNGFSFYGEVVKVPARALVTMTRKMIGETEDSIEGVLPAHSHKVNLLFGDDGRLKPGFTDEFLDHTHGIKKATATEVEWEHGHRLILVEN